MENLVLIVCYLMLAAVAAASAYEMYEIAAMICAPLFKKPAAKETMDPKKPKPKICPLACESYRQGRVGARGCLAGHWDEQDPHKLPLLLPDTLQPVIPHTCAAIKGDALLEDVLAKARRRGWR
jgi:hypothetical protein